MAELSSKYGVHRIMIQQWKKQGLDGFHTLFSTNQLKELKKNEELFSRLYEQIGQLKGSSLSRRRIFQ